MKALLLSRPGLVLLGFLAVAGYFLLTEHTAHLAGVLPYGLLLLCPLMHLFMHGGHGRHAGHSDDSALPGSHSPEHDNHSDWGGGR